MRIVNVSIYIRNSPGWPDPHCISVFTLGAIRLASGKLRGRESYRQFLDPCLNGKTESIQGPFRAPRALLGPMHVLADILWCTGRCTTGYRPRVLGGDILVCRCSKRGNPKGTLKLDPTVPEGTVQYEPNGGSLRETARNPGRISGSPLGP